MGLCSPSVKARWPEGQFAIPVGGTGGDGGPDSARAFCILVLVDALHFKIQKVQHSHYEYPCVVQSVLQAAQLAITYCDAWCIQTFAYLPRLFSVPRFARMSPSQVVAPLLSVSIRDRRPGWERSGADRHRERRARSGRHGYAAVTQRKLQRAVSKPGLPSSLIQHTRHSTPFHLHRCTKFARHCLRNLITSTLCCVSMRPSGSSAACPTATGTAHVDPLHSATAP